MQDELNLNSVISYDIERKRSKVKAELRFKGYLRLIAKDPKIAQNSHSRLLEICENAGVEEIPESERWLGANKRYKLFSKELFGVDKPINDIISYFNMGAKGLSTGKQILLLVGPPASGKSTFVNIVKKALEGYRLRPVYCIKGCPMHEEPLHLLPRYMRDQVRIGPKECEECRVKPNPGHLHLGIEIKGDLCPQCRKRLEDDYKEDDNVVRWWDFPVEQFTFSIQGARGIGSTEPSDEKTSDATTFVGRENISVSAIKGYDDPFAYVLAGELPKGNRGITEIREIFKCPTDILKLLLSAAEEQEIKVPGSPLPHISIDLITVSHTNLTEFNKFSSDKKNEALHNRIFVVPFPYPVRIKDEIKVYKKLILQESRFKDLKHCHIAPGAFELAATFAVLTRLMESQTGIDLMTKAKIYNGDIALTEIEDPEKKPIDIRELIEEGQQNPEISKREGMFGISSRDVLAALNMAIIEESRENGCLTPLKAIRALRNVFDHRMGFSPEEIERYNLFLSAEEESSIMTEYREFIIEKVSKAFLSAYEDLAKELFDKYIREAMLHRSLTRKFARGQILDIERDPMTGKPKEPDIKFLRSIEEHIPIEENEADSFRGEILESKATNKEFNYDSYPPLARAVEKKLLEDSKSTLTIILASDKPKTSEDQRRLQTLYENLTDPKRENPFCEICAKEAVEKAKEFLSE